MNTFEIRDPKIDTAEIGKIIAERIAQRHRYAQEHSINFDRLSQPTDLNEKSDEAIRWTLDLAEARQAAILIPPYTSSTDQGRLSSLISLLKKQAHNLVIYYINMLGQKQILFNESATWAIALQQARFERLQAKVSALEQEIQKLEVRLSAKETHTHE
jgi:hypothetical protein